MEGYYYTEDTNLDEYFIINNKDYKTLSYKLLKYIKQKINNYKLKLDKFQ